MDDLNILELVLLAVAGLGAGFINSVAGGGSLLTLPALLWVGLPPDMANATNRVAVALQSYAGGAAFDAADALDRSALASITIPSVAGAILGALMATVIPNEALEPLILVAMVAMGVLLVWKPTVVAPPRGTPNLTLRERPSGVFLLFLAGLYGGFLQVGVGFIYLMILGAVLRYDLVRANALKLVVIALYTTVAVVIFALSGLILWVPGLALSVGTIIGARLGVRFAVGAATTTLRWIVLVMIILTAVKVLAFD